MSAIRVTRHLYRLSWVDLSLSTGSSKEKTKKNYHSLLKTPIYISSLSLFRVRYRVWLVTCDLWLVTLARRGEERLWHYGRITRAMEARRCGHSSKITWATGWRREGVGTTAWSLCRQIGGKMSTGGMVWGASRSSLDSSRYLTP
jgi:hypothetical protein